MIPLPILDLNYIANPKPVTQCGGCTECCYAVAVEEVKKAYFRHCKYQKSTRCGIYEKRPQSCANYNCLYLLGYTSEDGIAPDTADRPDVLGFIFAGYKDNNGLMILEIIETRDVNHRGWQMMNIPLNNILKQLRFDAIKLFCYDTEIGTVFHTEPVDTYQATDEPMFAVVEAENFPPMFICTKAQNPSTLAKITSLLVDSKPRTMDNIEALKRKLGM